jgi:hypothetical protein
MFGFLTAMLVAQAPVASAPQHLGVTICHRTGSSGNAFVVITPDNQSIIEAHIGPIAHPPKGGRTDFLLPFPNGTKAQCQDADDPGDDVPGDDDPGDDVPGDDVPGDDVPGDDV